MLGALENAVDPSERPGKAYSRPGVELPPRWCPRGTYPLPPRWRRPGRTYHHSFQDTRERVRRRRRRQAGHRRGSRRSGRNQPIHAYLNKIVTCRFAVNKSMCCACCRAGWCSAAESPTTSPTRHERVAFNVTENLWKPFGHFYLYLDYFEL